MADERNYSCSAEGFKITHSGKCGNGENYITITKFNGGGPLYTIYDRESGEQLAKIIAPVGGSPGERRYSNLTKFTVDGKTYIGLLIESCGCCVEIRQPCEDITDTTTPVTPPPVTPPPEPEPDTSSTGPPVVTPEPEPCCEPCRDEEGIPIEWYFNSATRPDPEGFYITGDNIFIKCKQSIEDAFYEGIFWEVVNVGFVVKYGPHCWKITDDSIDFDEPPATIGGGAEGGGDEWNATGGWEQCKCCPDTPVTPPPVITSSTEPPVTPPPKEPCDPCCKPLGKWYFVEDAINDEAVRQGNYGNIYVELTKNEKVREGWKFNAETSEQAYDAERGEGAFDPNDPQILWVADPKKDLIVRDDWEGGRVWERCLDERRPGRRAGPPPDGKCFKVIDENDVKLFLNESPAFLVAQENEDDIIPIGAQGGGWEYCECCPVDEDKEPPTTEPPEEEPPTTGPPTSTTEPPTTTTTTVSCCEPVKEGELKGQWFYRNANFNCYVPFNNTPQDGLVFYSLYGPGVAQPEGPPGEEGAGAENGGDRQPDVSPSEAEVKEANRLAEEAKANWEEAIAREAPEDELINLEQLFNGISQGAHDARNARLAALDAAGGKGGGAGDQPTPAGPSGGVTEAQQQRVDAAAAAADVANDAIRDILNEQQALQDRMVNIGVRLNAGSGGSGAIAVPEPDPDPVSGVESADPDSDAFKKLVADWEKNVIAADEANIAVDAADAELLAARKDAGLDEAPPGGLPGGGRGLVVVDGLFANQFGRKCFKIIDAEWVKEGLNIWIPPAVDVLETLYGPAPHGGHTIDDLKVNDEGQGWIVCECCPTSPCCPPETCEAYWYWKVLLGDADPGALTGFPKEKPLEGDYDTRTVNVDPVTGEIEVIDGQPDGNLDAVEAGRAAAANQRWFKKYQNIYKDLGLVEVKPDPDAAGEIIVDYVPEVDLVLKHKVWIKDDPKIWEPKWWEDLCVPNKAKNVEEEKNDRDIAREKAEDLDDKIAAAQQRMDDNPGLSNIAAFDKALEERNAAQEELDEVLANNTPLAIERFNQQAEDLSFLVEQAQRDFDEAKAAKDQWWDNLGGLAPGPRGTELVLAMEAAERELNRLIFATGDAATQADDLQQALDEVGGNGQGPVVQPEGEGGIPIGAMVIPAEQIPDGKFPVRCDFDKNHEDEEFEVCFKIFDEEAEEWVREKGKLGFPDHIEINPAIDVLAHQDDKEFVHELEVGDKGKGWEVCECCPCPPPKKKLPEIPPPGPKKPVITPPPITTVGGGGGGGFTPEISNPPVVTPPPTTTTTTTTSTTPPPTVTTLCPPDILEGDVRCKTLRF